MASDFDQEDLGSESFSPESENSFQPTPTPTPTPAAQSPAEFTPKAWDDVLPSSIPGGLDSKAATIDKQINNLQLQRPSYNDNGTLTYTAPTSGPVGYIDRMGGVSQQVSGFSPPSIQEQKIQELQSQRPRFTDQAIFSMRSTILDGLMTGTGNKPLTPENYINNPFWGTLADRGATPSEIDSIQKSALHFIAPIAKQQQKYAQFNGMVEESMKDPSVAPFIQPFVSLFNSKPGSAQAINYINIAKEKAQMLTEDPTLSDAFDTLKNSQNGDDQRTYKGLLVSQSASRFNSMLGGWMKKQEMVIDKRNSLYDILQKKFEGIDGEDAGDAWSGYANAVSAGKYDGNAAGLTKDVSALFEGTSKGMGPLYKNALERDTKDQIELRQKDGGMIDDLFIIHDGAGKPKVISRYGPNGEDQYEKFKQQEMKIAFGHSDITIHPEKVGDWVKLPVGVFQDEQGNNLIPTLPGEAGPSKQAYVDGDDMYVLKKVLQKIGVDPLADLYDSKSKTWGTHTVSAQENPYFTANGSEFKPSALPAADFLEGTPGNRFDVEDPSTRRYLDSIQDGLKKLNLGPTLTPPEAQPTMFGEVLKAAAKPWVKLAAQTLMTPGAWLNEGNHLFLGMLNEVAGDEGAAMQYYRKGLGGDGELTGYNLSGSIEKDMENGMWNMDAVMANPQATTPQKVVSTLVGGLSSLGTFIAETELTGASATAGKVTQLASEFVPVLKNYQKLAEAGAIGTDIVGAATRANLVSRVIHDSVLFPIVSAVTGSATTAADLLKQAGMGALFGGVSTIGEGFGLPLLGGKTKLTTFTPKKWEGYDVGGFDVSESEGAYKLLPSASRAAAALGASAVVFGVEHANDFSDGKGRSQILAELKDPVKMVDLLQNTFWMMMGNHKFGMAPERPAEPPSTMEELQAKAAPAAQAVGSAKEVGGRIAEIDAKTNPTVKEKEEQTGLIAMAPSKNDAEIAKLKADRDAADSADEKQKIEIQQKQAETARVTAQERLDNLMSGTRTALQTIKDGGKVDLSAIHPDVSEALSTDSFVRTFPNGDQVITPVGLSILGMKPEEARADYEQRLGVVQSRNQLGPQQWAGVPTNIQIMRDGGTMEAHYHVVDANDIEPSHNAPDPIAVDEMANRPPSDINKESPNASEGAPVVVPFRGADGKLVYRPVTGDAGIKTAAMKRLYSDPAMEAQRDAHGAHAVANMAHLVNPEAFAKVKNPVVVRALHGTQTEGWTEAHMAHVEESTRAQEKPAVATAEPAPAHAPESPAELNLGVGAPAVKEQKEALQILGLDKNVVGEKMAPIVRAVISSIADASGFKGKIRGESVAEVKAAIGGEAGAYADSRKNHIGVEIPNLQNILSDTKRPIADRLNHVATIIAHEVSHIALDRRTNAIERAKLDALVHSISSDFRKSIISKIGSDDPNYHAGDIDTIRQHLIDRGFNPSEDAVRRYAASEFMAQVGSWIIKGKIKTSDISPQYHPIIEAILGMYRQIMSSLKSGLDEVASSGNAEERNKFRQVYVELNRILDRTTTEEKSMGSAREALSASRKAPKPDDDAQVRLDLIHKTDDELRMMGVPSDNNSTLFASINDRVLSDALESEHEEDRERKTVFTGIENNEALLNERRAQLAEAMAGMTPHDINLAAAIGRNLVKTMTYYGKENFGTDYDTLVGKSLPQVDVLMNWDVISKNLTGDKFASVENLSNAFDAIKREILASGDFRRIMDLPYRDPKNQQKLRSVLDQASGSEDPSRFKNSTENVADLARIEAEMQFSLYDKAFTVLRKRFEPEFKEIIDKWSRTYAGRRGQLYMRKGRYEATAPRAYYGSVKKSGPWPVGDGDFKVKIFIKGESPKEFIGGSAEEAEKMAFEWRDEHNKQYEKKKDSIELMQERSTKESNEKAFEEMEPNELARDSSGIFEPNEIFDPSTDSGMARVEAKVAEGDFDSEGEKELYERIKSGHDAALNFFRGRVTGENMDDFRVVKGLLDAVPGAEEQLMERDDFKRVQSMMKPIIQELVFNRKIPYEDAAKIISISMDHAWRDVESHVSHIAATEFKDVRSAMDSMPKEFRNSEEMKDFVDGLRDRVTEDADVKEMKDRESQMQMNLDEQDSNGCVIQIDPRFPYKPPSGGELNL